MPSLRWQTRDDRGRRVPLGTVSGTRVSTTIPAGPRERMEDKFRSELWASWEYRILVGALTLFTIALGIAIAFFGAPSWTAWAAGLFVVVFALAYRRFIQ